jgi:hypothetical protein
VDRGDEQDPLATPVFCDGEYRPFGELSAADARRRGEELAEAGSWGPLAKVAGVANAWRELAGLMEAGGVARVADLEREQALAFARRLWVVPPRGSLL